MGSPIFKNEKWKMKCLTEGFFKNKRFEKVKSQSFKLLTNQLLKCRIQCLNGLHLQWLIFENFKDWFLKASKIDFLNFWFFHFWKMRLLYLYLNSNISKMKNEELQTWTIKTEKPDQKWKIKNSIIEFIQSVCKPRGSPPLVPRGVPGGSPRDIPLHGPYRH